MAKYAPGSKAVGICQRSGIKMLRKDMVEDGYYPGLMVHPEWKDERHPQERLPKLDDPTSIYKPAPDDVGEPPALSAELVGDDGVLEWTEAEPINARVHSYDVYRKVDDGDWVLLESLPVTYDIFMAITDQTLEYTDEGLEAGHEYSYQVIANTNHHTHDVMPSNIVVLDVDSIDFLLTPLAGELTMEGVAPSVTAVADADFGTAIAQTDSEEVNGMAFTAPASWAFGTSDFTCEFWHLCNGIVVDTPAIRILRARSTGGAQSGWDVEIRPNGAGTTKFMRINMRPVTTTFIFDSPVVSVANAEWHHYAFVVDRVNNLVTYYIDGVEIGNDDISTVSGNVGTSGSGRRLLEGVLGYVDDLRIWTVARTAEEIAENFEEQFPDPSSVPNLIANWQFDEGSGATTTESIESVAVTLGASNDFVPGPVP